MSALKKLQVKAEKPRFGSGVSIQDLAGVLKMPEQDVARAVVLVQKFARKLITMKRSVRLRRQKEVDRRQAKRRRRLHSMPFEIRSDDRWKPALTASPQPRLTQRCGLAVCSTICECTTRRPFQGPCSRCLRCGVLGACSFTPDRRRVPTASHFARAYPHPRRTCARHGIRRRTAR